MVLGVEGIIWYLILIDAIGANIVIWFFSSWYKKKFKWLTKHFPASKWLATGYLILVLWVGYGLNRLGMLS